MSNILRIEFYQMQSRSMQILVISYLEYEDNSTHTYMSM